MPQLNFSEIVNAPPRRAFDAFSDLRNADKNVGAIKKIELLTDGPIAKGTRFRATRVMFKRECTETMEVTQWNPQAAPPSFAIGGESGGARIETMIRVHLAGSAHATRVASAVGMKAVTPIAE